MRGLGVMLVVCVVLAAVFYLGRTQPSPVSMTEEGKVVAKDTIVTKEGGGRRVLGISLPLPNGGQRNVVIECSEEQWQQFRIGDTVVAHFTTPRAGGDVVVTSIESKPAAVEL
ncbi:MAG: hypothetical protein FJY92_10305 [Candidatus Hydrogenedentes bacterium]|nr:hypothetical protein [Candidatus Hydrogenedentota bacterium]